MHNIRKNSENNFSQIKRNKIQKNIQKKINIIKEKICKKNSMQHNVYLHNKITKLQEKINFISLKPKQKNRLKEIRRIELRIYDYTKKIKFLNKDITEENKIIIKLENKINKLKKRKDTLNSDYFEKTHKKRDALAIRMTFRRTRYLDNIII